VEHQAAELVSERIGGRLPVSPAGRLLVTDMDGSAQEGPGGEDDAPGGHFAGPRQRGARDAVAAEEERENLVLEDRESGRGLQDGPHPVGVDVFVALGAIGADGGAASCVENAELEPGEVGVAGHLAAEGVDLEDEVRLGDSADRGIARHSRDLVEPKRRKERPRAEPRGGKRRFAPGVPAPHDEDVEIWMAVVHGNGAGFYVSPG